MITTTPPSNTNILVNKTMLIVTFYKYLTFKNKSKTYQVPQPKPHHMPKELPGILQDIVYCLYHNLHHVKHHLTFCESLLMSESNI